MADTFMLSRDEVIRGLSTDPVTGLTDAEAQRRIAITGPNEICERERKTVWSMLREQICQIMVAVLAASLVLSLMARELYDAIAIGIILLINICLGFMQEFRAERAIEALTTLTVPTVTVRRSARSRRISAREVAPGDIVLLEAGGIVPADVRLLTTWSLTLQEAALTGESAPVHKDADAVCTCQRAVGDTINGAFMGTFVASGRAEAVVVATGEKTELGRIASMLGKVAPEPTPLQRRLDRLGKQLAAASLLIVAVVVCLGAFRHESPRTLFMTGISLAVAAVPEGLPAVVTVALALGAQRMAKRQALVRRLAAVETLGGVDVICSDKTGTLTTNRMTVTALDICGHRLDPGAVNGPGQEPAATVADPALTMLLAGAALCNDASAEDDRCAGTRFEGDPTEVALVEAAANAGMNIVELRSMFPRIAEEPFSSRRKRMTTVHRRDHGADGPWTWDRQEVFSGVTGGSKYFAVTKGAAEIVMAHSTCVVEEGAVGPLSPHWREAIQRANTELASAGMRVLAVAVKPIADAEVGSPANELESNLIFVGLIGMMDPPRQSVQHAVATCARAGIRPVMITGDHPLTARAVARDLGIEPADMVITGVELDGMSPPALEDAVEAVSIFARVSPEHKLRIVQALQSRGHVVGMTGDGVNDGPALKQARIGIAMGKEGTDVARAAADLVLLDDNYGTIVAAIEEGRVIDENIRKFVKYQIGSNSSEIWVMLLAPLVGMPLPLLPLQILWINLVTDGPPALALALENADSRIMVRAPRPADSPLLSRRTQVDVVRAGLVMAASALVPGYVWWSLGRPEWQTIVFTILVLSQMANAIAVRSGRDSVFRRTSSRSTAVFSAAALAVVLHLACVYLGGGQQVLDTVPLTLGDLAVVVAASSSVLWVSEISKWLHRRTDRRARDIQQRGNPGRSVRTANRTRATH